MNCEICGNALAAGDRVAVAQHNMGDDCPNGALVHVQCGEGANADPCGCGGAITGYGGEFVYTPQSG